MIPAELKGFIREGFNEPPFYIEHRPGSEIDAAQILLWVAECLEMVPHRSDKKWRLWLSEMAYGMVKERFCEFITLELFNDRIWVPSPTPGEWSIWVRLAGADGSYEDMVSDEIIDKVTITLEIDDGNDGFMG